MASTFGVDKFDSKNRCLNDLLAVVLMVAAAVVVLVLVVKNYNALNVLCDWRVIYKRYFLCDVKIFHLKQLLRSDNFPL